MGKEIKSAQYIHHLTNLIIIINFPFAINNCVIENGSGSNQVVCKTKSSIFFILLIYIYIYGNRVFFFKKKNSNDSLNYYKEEGLSHTHNIKVP